MTQKNNKRITLLSVITIFLSCFSGGYSAIPEKINTQGILQTSDGNTISSPKNVIFKLVDSPTAASLIWSSPTVTINPESRGFFSQDLDLSGSGLTFDKQYWLLIKVEGEELTRQPLYPVPYAFRAKWIDSPLSNDFLFVSKKGDKMSGTLTIEVSSSATGAIVYNYNKPGVWGKSYSSYGVVGESSNEAGVFGEANGIGSGVIGSSETGDGVYGSCGYGYGVYGSSTNGRGVYGFSQGNYGVDGFTREPGKAGVTGHNRSGIGVFGASGSQNHAGVKAENFGPTVGTPGPALEIKKGWLKVPFASAPANQREIATPPTYIYVHEVTLNALAGVITNGAMPTYSVWVTVYNNKVRGTSNIIATLYSDVPDGYDRSYCYTSVKNIRDGSFEIWYPGRADPAGTKEIGFLVLN